MANLKVNAKGGSGGRYWARVLTNLTIFALSTGGLESVRDVTPD